MELKPFLEKLYDISPKSIFPSSLEDLEYKITSVIHTYFGEFKNGSLYLGVEDPVTSDELSDLISMQESDTNDYLNTIRVLGLSTVSLYKNYLIKPKTKWMDYNLRDSLDKLFYKNTKDCCFSFEIHSKPILFSYTVTVHLSYSKEGDGSIILSFSIKENGVNKENKAENRELVKSNNDKEGSLFVKGVVTMNDVENNLENNLENKKYTGYYASVDGSMDAEVVINKFNLSWNRGNVLKYIIRAGKKDPNKEIEDLEKARNYINYEIERLKEIKMLSKE